MYFFMVKNQQVPIVTIYVSTKIFLEGYTKMYFQTREILPVVLAYLQVFEWRGDLRDVKREAARDATRALDLLQSVRFFSPARNARLKDATEQKAADLPHKQHIHRGHSRKCVWIVVRLSVGYWMPVRLVLTAMCVCLCVCVLERCARSDTPSRAKSVIRTQRICSLSFCI